MANISFTSGNKKMRRPTQDEIRKYERTFKTPIDALDVKYESDEPGYEKPLQFLFRSNSITTSGNKKKKKKRGRPKGVKNTKKRSYTNSPPEYTEKRDDPVVHTQLE